ncbi:MAG TPA: MoaD/ThiS family protein [Acidimicrobiales bacterium]|nr:MoaD/ThiS family protein [Acidimicrobiales bacterium]
MPRLRLFGPIADAAGTRVDLVEGSSVEEVVDAATVRYGASFADQARLCRVWVNGEAPPPGLVLDHDDEVALLPPVSGG